MKRDRFLTLRMQSPLILFLLILSLTPAPSLAQVIGGQQMPGGMFGPPPQSPQPTLEEEEILRLHSTYLLWYKEYGPNHEYTLRASKAMGVPMSHYQRSRCKDHMVGQWIFREKGDRIHISYDEQYKVFVGRVTAIVSFDPNWVKPGYVLFKVYFAPGLAFSYPTDTALTLDMLRRDAQCRDRFTGEEYSFKRQGDRMVSTKSTINIQPQEDRNLMLYMTNKNYTLVRTW